MLLTPHRISRRLYVGPLCGQILVSKGIRSQRKRVNLNINILISVNITYSKSSLRVIFRDLPTRICLILRL